MSAQPCVVHEGVACVVPSHVTIPVIQPADGPATLHITHVVSGLAVTGIDVALLVTIALLCIVAGCGFVWATRR